MNQIIKNHYQFIKKQISTRAYSAYASLFLSSFAIQYLIKDWASPYPNIGPTIQVSKGIWKNKYIPNRNQ